jgi:hypothetical protein
MAKTKLQIASLQTKKNRTKVRAAASQMLWGFGMGTPEG